ncbi:hypothetical protein GALMADRAFT_135173 [Galerina marginata CBS 339.88]|uniref:Uncharacterized protein n=1 Tax=Galerina marginata (strain CBS 339.88) TaxID=685588 RepID=A0A067TS03_GALM3|nr:hypothetical protein GALMADRAFT_135173 [Galerina marginata CBS 339.88]
MSTTTTKTSAASVTMLIVIGSALILTTLIGLFICTCYRSPPSRLHRHNRTISQRNPFQPDFAGHRRHRIYYLEDSSPLCGIKNIFGRRSLVGSNSLPESIRISPSQPTIFGDGNDIELSVKVVLTPPTPAKAEVPLSPSEEEEEENDRVIVPR